MRTTRRLTLRTVLGICFVSLLVGCGSDSSSTADAQAQDQGSRDASVDPDAAPDPDIGIQFDFGPPPADTGKPDKIIFADTLPHPDTQAPLPDKGPLPDLAVPDVSYPDTTVVDASQPDGPVIAPDVTPVGDGPATCAEAIGKTCTETGGECGTAAFCLLTSTQGGVCTCPCVPNDPANACPDPAVNVCGAVELSDGTTYGFCFQACQPKLGANDCTAPLACLPQSVAYSSAYDQAVCLFNGCQSNDDCPVITSTACDTVAGGCGANETCLALTATGTAGLCARPGTCDTASGLCGGKPAGSFDASAKVGDPCSGDTDCGQYMACELQRDPKAAGLKDHGAACSQSSECCGSCNPNTNTCQGTCVVHARNGYCLMTGCVLATATDYSEFACPTGSTCNRLFYGGICMKSCDLAVAATCRGNAGDYYGDYECRAWNRITMMDGTPLASTPVCEFGGMVPCHVLGSAYGCSDLGDQTNSTNMTCRTIAGQLTADPADPRGFCFDDTSSGGQPTGLKQFGDLCSVAAPDCAPGLTCLPFDATTGFCSEVCTNVLEECPGAPAGTFAGCILPYDGSDYCAFICQLGDPPQTWSCPGGMTCDPSPNPAGTTQHLCQP